MKKALISILAFGLALTSVFAQGISFERVFLSTDRNFYAAGETIYLSAFCTDGNGDLSTFSAVAYVELFAEDGMVASAELGLFGGRGAGSLTIPAGLPTGNYRLAAYTAIAKNIPDFDYTTGSRVLSVYNTESVQKAADVVFTDTPSVTRTERTEFGGISISREGDTFSIVSPNDATISVSIYKDEDLPVYDNAGIDGFMANIPKYTSYVKNVIPEYEGQILYASVDGASELEGTDLYIATPGNNNDLYAATLRDGKATFFSANIYGDKDMAVMLKEKSGQWQADFKKPFVGLKGVAAPALELSESMKGAIERLGTAAAITKAFDADTLYSQMPSRRMKFLGDNCKRYKLDDYTRFRTMQEVFIEILGGTTVRSTANGREVFVRCEDDFNQTPAYRANPCLVILDGVPVLDHDLILEFDPLMIKSVEVYPFDYSFGITNYSGILSFSTYKADLGGFKFGDNVKIISFKGLSYPLAFTNAGFPESYPTVRQTLYWSPLHKLAAGEPSVLNFNVPDEPGRYVIKIEGMTAKSRQPIYKELVF